jgi:hypothetical protein
MVVNFDDAQSSSSAEKDSINTLVVDKVVGAWQGGRRREFGEEGGGAPCPQEFVLREDERYKEGKIRGPNRFYLSNKNPIHECIITRVLFFSSAIYIFPQTSK